MLLSPSMMCARYDNLEREIKLLEEAGADSFHVDIMDGCFVPNFAMGLEDLKCISRLTSIPIDVHLMIKEPGNYAHLFALPGVDVMYIHPQSTYHPTTVIEKIIDAGKTPGVVIDPGTSIESVVELLNVVRKVMVMGVNPGHAGQAYLPYVEAKIETLSTIQSAYKIDLSIDGACNLERIKRWHELGVNGFVLGTSVLFGNSNPYNETIAAIRKGCHIE